MHPILFHYGSLTIYSYGVMVAIAAFVSMMLLTAEAGRNGFDRNTIFDFGMAILLSGIIGARLFYILLNLSFYRENPLEMVMIHHGGLAILGGIVGGLCGGLLFTWRKKLSFLVVMDMTAPFVALGHSIGRIGCFLNGCCYGIVSPYGCYFPSLDATVIPTQLIESFFLVMLFIILRRAQQTAHKPGSIISLYLILYAVIRFFIEFLRGDSPRLLFGLTLFQYVCLGLLALGGLLRVYFLRKKQ